MCHNLILQLTHSFKLSYAELVGPSTVTWFVSHYWGTSFRHFVDTVSRGAMQKMTLSSPKTWGNEWKSRGNEWKSRLKEVERLFLLP